MKMNLYNPTMANPNDEDTRTVTDLLGEDSVTLYGFCPNCDEIHGDLHRIVDYLQWLSDQSMINFN
jgi:hypothetical protein